MNNKSGFFAFLLGAAVGAAIGLLYAPRTGKETRAHLRRLGEDFVDNVESFGEEVKEKGKKLVEEGKTKIAEVIEKGKMSYSKVGKSSHSQEDDIIE